MRAIRCTCLALLLSAPVLAAAAQEARRDLIWGVNGHPFVSYPGVTIEQQLDYVKDLGMTSYRVDVVRAEQAPGLARLVRAAKARGIEILPVITPALNLDNEAAPDLYTKAYQLAVELVSKFKDDIRVWELGNEMENYAIIQPCETQDDGVQYNCAWGPAGGVGPLEYYGPRWAKVSAVLKGLSDGTTVADPTIRKAMGTAGWGHLGAFTRMQQDGIRWDISVWHMYGQDPEWAYKFLADFNRPIWVTEFNHPGGSQRSEQEQADGLIRAMTRLRQLQRTYKIEAAHVYELMDEPYWTPSFEAFMGLVGLVKDSNGRWAPGPHKPAYTTVKQLIADAGSLAALMSECHLNSYNRLSSDAAMQVSYSYCLVLDRRADGAGLKAWIAALDNGATVLQMLQAMMGSVEFRSKHAVSGVSNSDFVGLLYRLLLDREPDGAEHSTYVSKLDGSSITHADVSAAIINSADFKSRHPLLFVASNSDRATIRRTCDLKSFGGLDVGPQNRVAYGYCLVLGRNADGAGLQSWLKAIAQGVTLGEILLAMIDSEEFKSKHAISGLSSSRFVTTLYRVILNREPDDAGLSSYVAQLDHGGLGRTQMAAALIASSEFGMLHPILLPAQNSQPASRQLKDEKN